MALWEHGQCIFALSYNARHEAPRTPETLTQLQAACAIIALSSHAILPAIAGQSTRHVVRKDASLLFKGLSHYSCGRSPSPDTVPAILTPLRGWLRKRVPWEIISNPFFPHEPHLERRTYLAKALAKAFLQLTFCPPTNESTVTAMARSTSCEVQYSDRRILQKASLIRMMASR